MRQPHGEHRHQALTAGEDLRVVAVLGEQINRLVDGVGAVIGERGSFHDMQPREGGLQVIGRPPVCASAAQQETDHATGDQRRDCRRGPLGHRHRDNLQQIDGVAGTGRRLPPRFAVRRRRFR